MVLEEDVNIGLTFGEKGRLKIIGKLKTSKSKTRYVLYCDICSLDSELFPENSITSELYNLKNGNLPCGCSKFPKWSEQQMRIKIQRICHERGYEFHGWVGDYKGNKTNVGITSPLGYSKSQIIARLLRGEGCPLERLVKIGISKRKTEEEVIQSFMKTGAFLPGTKFERSFKNSNPSDFWIVSCPLCGDSAESYRSNLQKGKMPCSCSKHNQTKCYINLLYKDEDCMALKFGKATLPDRRIKEQQQKCVYDIRQYGVWQFPNKGACLLAELECLNSLSCRLLSFEEMPDGWSETTYPLNIERVIEIYEKNGGFRI